MLTYNTPLRTHMIYALTDPRDGLVHYIGRTCRPADRLSRHMEGDSPTPKGAWIRELKAAGLRAGMVILERIEPSQIDETWEERARCSTETCSTQSVRENAFDLLIASREDVWMRHAEVQAWPIMNRHRPSVIKPT